MRKEQFYSFINDPSRITEKDLPELLQLTSDFPYFQAAHLLLSVASRRWDISLYQKTLRRTAIAVPSRSRLFELVQKAEQQMSAPIQEIVSTVQPENAGLKKEIKTDPEQAGEELDILKAAELSTPPEGPAVQKDKGSPGPEPDEQIEKEIAREVVTAFVEKEILRTPEVQKPPVRPREEPSSFGDWLSYLKKNNGQPYKEIERQVNEEKEKQREAADPQPAREAINQVTSKKERQKAIIDKIIESSPGHIKYKDDQKFFVPEIKAKESLLENEHLVTETLARIYALQGNTGKAIRAYQILSLKYPQKSAYFATLIQKLKTNQKD